MNYIKFNLKTSEEAFQLFDITKEKSLTPDIPASIIQKLANRSNITPTNVNEKLLVRNEYKAMLKTIQKGLG